MHYHLSIPRALTTLLFPNMMLISNLSKGIERRGDDGLRGGEVMKKEGESGEE
jgi:hypothetical protein